MAKDTDLFWHFCLSGDSTFFYRSARAGSTSMSRCCSSETAISGWPKSFKASLGWVVGTEIMPVLPPQKNSAEISRQLITSNQLQQTKAVTGLCMAHQSELHCTILGVHNIPTFIFVPESNHKNLTAKTSSVRRRKK